MKKLIKLSVEINELNLQGIVANIYGIDTILDQDAKIVFEPEKGEQFYWIRSVYQTFYFMINILEIEEDYTLFTIQKLIEDNTTGGN